MSIFFTLEIIIFTLCLIGAIVAGISLGHRVAISEVNHTPVKCDKFLSVDDAKIIRAQNLFYDQCMIMRENPQIPLVNQPKLTRLYRQIAKTKQAILDIRCEILNEEYGRLLESPPPSTFMSFFRREYRNFDRQQKQKEDNLNRLLSSYHDCLNQINAILAISIINANIPIGI